MKDFRLIVEDIKDIISVDIKGKVFDKDVARILHVKPTTLAINKTRNIIMYEEILEFCAKRKIAVNSLLFGQDAESLVENTNKMFYNRYSLIA